MAPVYNQARNIGSFMVSGITIEASIDNVHTGSEMLYSVPPVPHDRLLIFSDTNSLYPEHAAACHTSVLPL